MNPTVALIDIWFIYKLARTRSIHSNSIDGAPRAHTANRRGGDDRKHERRHAPALERRHSAIPPTATNRSLNESGPLVSDWQDCRFDTTSLKNSSRREDTTPNPLPSRMGKSLKSASGSWQLAGWIAVAGAMGLLSGCAADAGPPAPVPTVTVTIEAEPDDGSALAGGDRSAAYACGRYSSLISIESATQRAMENGDVSADAYTELLRRQAFQLSTVITEDPALTTAATAVADYLKTATPTTEGWPYDPRSDEWLTLTSDLASACTEAGSELANWVEPGMGG